MQFFLSIAYGFILFLLALLAIPKMIFSLIFYKKYRHSLFPRMGINYPKFEKKMENAIWIHGVSVGETKAIVPLARHLKQRFPESPIIISTVTETGYEEGKRSLPFADYHVYLPFDFGWLVSKIVKRASPKLVILSESDFWYHFLYYCKKNGASIALVNGKLSEKSMRRYSMVSFFPSRYLLYLTYYASKTCCTAAVLLRLVQIQRRSL